MKKLGVILQALIDMDLVAYRCAASAEQDPEHIAILRCDKLVRDILEQTGATEYRGFLTGTENFRKEIDPEYKANRTEPRPIHLEVCRTYLVTDWKAEVQDGIEADDALGINQTEETIICSLDKDLLQIPGKHYRWEIATSKWKKDAEFLDISERDGLLNFYISSLVGDRSDNIIGVHGLGPAKSKKLLSHLSTEQEMFDVCREQYKDDERLLKNLKLLWILRNHGEIYDLKQRCIKVN